MAKRLDYMRRCKKKEGFETYETLHASEENGTHTLCGKELNEMWYIVSSAGLTPEDVTCPKCKKAI